jgi:hypothetical protein
MHLWSAITAASACLARHAWLDFGIGQMYANKYVLLVGPPGTRKNHAIKFAINLVHEATQVRLAPDDTSGQRQGLITAIEGTREDDKNHDALARVDIDDALSLTEALSTHHMELNNVDRHSMLAVATEFGSFMGQNNLDLTRFLNKLWDGEDYNYQLKKEQAVLKEPLLTLIGGTTPTDISLILPAEAMGQGFMSRIILVFGAKKEKHVPRPNLDTSQEKFLKDTYGWLFDECHGAFHEDKSAQELLDYLYPRPVGISDNRFMYYSERRHTHLLKLCLILAATDRRKIINHEDVEQAQYILELTERLMPDALGEYGLSPLATARQKMLEFIQHAGQPVPDKLLWTVMRNDMKLIDYKNSITAMLNAKKIVLVDTKLGQAYVYNDQLQEAVAYLDSTNWNGINND